MWHGRALIADQTQLYQLIRWTKSLSVFSQRLLLCCSLVVSVLCTITQELSHPILFSASLMPPQAQFVENVAGGVWLSCSPSTFIFTGLCHLLSLSSPVSVITGLCHHRSLSSSVSVITGFCHHRSPSSPVSVIRSLSSSLCRHRSLSSSVSVITVTQCPLLLFINERFAVRTPHSHNRCVSVSQYFHDRFTSAHIHKPLAIKQLQQIHYHNEKHIWKANKHPWCWCFQWIKTEH